MKKKTVALLMACTMSLGCAIGGTLAWLTDSTEEVVNTFTDSDVSIDLTETKNDFKMIPGWTIAKDPVVTVEKGSEPCYVFVKIEEDLGAWEGAGAEFTDYLSYTVKTGADGWTQLKNAAKEDVAGVYYIEIDSETADDIEYQVLTGDGSTGDNATDFCKGMVTVSSDVTKSMMDLIDGVDENGSIAKDEIDARPTLTFTAYAIQLYKSNNTPWADAYEAWEEIGKTSVALD